MAIIYLLIIVAKSPFLVLKYLLKNKMLLAVVFVGITIAVVYSRMTGGTNPVMVPEYIRTAPETPKVVQTSSRIYYLNSYQDAGDRYMLTDYYEYAGGEWVRRNRYPLPLPKSRAEIIER